MGGRCRSGSGAAEAAAAPEPKSRPRPERNASILFSKTAHRARDAAASRSAARRALASRARRASAALARASAAFLSPSIRRASVTASNSRRFAACSARASRLQVQTGRADRRLPPPPPPPPPRLPVSRGGPRTACVPVSPRGSAASADVADAAPRRRLSETPRPIRTRRARRAPRGAAPAPPSRRRRRRALSPPRRASRRTARSRPVAREGRRRLQSFRERLQYRTVSVLGCDRGPESVERERRRVVERVSARDAQRALERGDPRAFAREARFERRRAGPLPRPFLAGLFEILRAFAMRRARHVVTGTRSDTRVEVVAERRRAVAGRERWRLRARREPRPGGFRGVEVPRFPVHVGGGVPVRRRRRVTPVAARGGGRSLPMRDFSAPGGRARAQGAHFWTTHVRARARVPRTDLQVCSDSLFQRSREVVAVARRRGGLRPRRGARWARRQSEVVGPRLPRTGGHGARRATTGQRGPLAREAVM